MQRLFVSFLLFACGAVHVTEAVGQQWSSASIEASFGPALGGGGSYIGRGGLSLSVLFGLPLQDTSWGTLTAGLSPGLDGSLTSDLICVSDIRGECIREFPLFFSVGALLGAQWGSAAGMSARLLAGPAYYHAHEDDATLGLQSRLEVATPTFLHTAVVASLRGAVLPDFQGDALGLVSLGLGLRIQ